MMKGDIVLKRSDVERNSQQQSEFICSTRVWNFPGKTITEIETPKLNYLENHMTRIMGFTTEQINYCYKVVKINYYDNIKRGSILAFVRRTLF